MPAHHNVMQLVFFHEARHHDLGDEAQLSAQISLCCFALLFSSFFCTSFALLTHSPCPYFFSASLHNRLRDWVRRRLPDLYRMVSFWPWSVRLPIISPFTDIFRELTYARAMIPRPPPLKRRSRRCPRKLRARKRRSTGLAPAPAASRSCWCYISASLISHTPLSSSSS